MRLDDMPIDLAPMTWVFAPGIKKSDQEPLKRLFAQDAFDCPPLCVRGDHPQHPGNVGRFGGTPLNERAARGLSATFATTLPLVPPTNRHHLF
jgi:hypothetical protein